MTRRRHAHIFAKQEHGHYVEPAWCSARLLAVENFGPRGTLIADPACGFGTIACEIERAGYRVLASDVVMRPRPRSIPYSGGFGFFSRDFLNGYGERLSERPRSIICNPPFDHVEEFCRRACEIATHKVAMISPLRRLPAAHWLQELPLETIYLLTPRPSMPPGEYIMAGNTPGGGSQDFVWLVFNKQRRGAPKMRFLHRDAAE
jgi:hypothetical protein